MCFVLLACVAVFVSLVVDIMTIYYYNSHNGRLSRSRRQRAFPGDR